METVFLPGTEVSAPTCLTSVAKAPTWNGKRLQQLTKDELDDMLAFCMREGKKIGYDDYRFGRPLRLNPFHRRYLHGMPHLYFRSFYEMGRKAAREARATIADQMPLLAAA